MGSWDDNLKEGCDSVLYNVRFFFEREFPIRSWASWTLPQGRTSKGWRQERIRAAGMTPFLGPAFLRRCALADHHMIHPRWPPSQAAEAFGLGPRLHQRLPPPQGMHLEAFFCANLKQKKNSQHFESRPTRRLWPMRNLTKSSAIRGRLHPKQTDSLFHSKGAPSALEQASEACSALRSTSHASFSF